MRFHWPRIARTWREKPTHELHRPFLPVEIIGQIFIFACEEDGALGRSLSVVCKAAHSVTKYAARFDTVNLRSGTEREVRRCMSLLSEARADAATRRDWVARPIVRHLCVLVSSTDAWKVMYHNLRIHALNVDWDPTRAVEATFIIKDSLNDAIQELILQVAPDLETLCMLRIPRTREDRMLLPSDIDTIRYGRGFGGFPKLRDLLFVGNLLFEPSQDNHGAEDDDNDDADEAGNQDANLKAPNAPLFPALKRIHVAHCLSNNNNAILIDRWVQEAPALESLRMTLSMSKGADEPESSLVERGLATSQMLSMFGGTTTLNVDSGSVTGALVFSGFPLLKETVVVITRSLVPPGGGKGAHKGIARRMLKRLTTPKTKPDPRVTPLSRRYSFSPPRDDCFDATEQYMDQDWRERVANPTSSGIDLYQFSQAFKRNVTVYWTTLEGPR
ncbi:hypothetical protein V8D89_006386 [Ganoderma adspersum]